ncbi:sigma-70 family RNA polymerase sigma factor [bacterium]|nr:sigma-70 family RNA polymerase sigma factor [bacterium]
MDKWQKFERDIAKIVARLTPDGMLQQDLAQEMRVHIWLAPEGRTRSWYLSGARWRALNFMTRTAIDCPDGDLDRQVVLYGILGDVDPEVLRVVPTEWQTLIKQAPIDAIHEAFAVSMEVSETIALLTKRQQQVLYALVQGFTHEEIGQTLGVSRRTVATEVTRIRAVFREAEQGGGLLS